MNIELLSKEIKKLIENKVGYRSEDIYGEGYDDVKEVCIWETFELCNSDIPETILTLYPHLLSEDETNLFTRLSNAEHEDWTDEEVEENMEVFGDICERVAKTILGYEDGISCVWLCSTKDEVKNYISNMVGCSRPELRDEQIDTYKIPDKFCVLSDIGAEGVLIAW